MKKKTVKALEKIWSIYMGKDIQHIHSLKMAKKWCTYLRQSKLKYRFIFVAFDDLILNFYGSATAKIPLKKNRTGDFAQLGISLL